MKRKKKLIRCSFGSELERLIFGVKSERFVAATGPEQGHLDFGSSSEQQTEAPATETITYERENRGSNKKAITASAASPIFQE
ncbi:MAG: hypothetical protein IPG01_02535 [Chitinophagaceae bacterium]|nr:hypothetical protein [Chitinophagaceae bacterium]